MPRLDFERRAAIRKAVRIPLVLHGASGLPETLGRGAIELGVCKLNVNTEVRQAQVTALRQALTGGKSDMLDLMQAAVAAMRMVISSKLQLFGWVRKG